VARTRIGDVSRTLRVGVLLTSPMPVGQCVPGRVPLHQVGTLAIAAQRGGMADAAATAMRRGIREAVGRPVWPRYTCRMSTP